MRREDDGGAVHEPEGHCGRSGMMLERQAGARRRYPSGLSPGLDHTGLDKGRPNRHVPSTRMLSPLFPRGRLAGWLAGQAATLTIRLTPLRQPLMIRRTGTIAGLCASGRSGGHEGACGGGVSLGCGHKKARKWAGVEQGFGGKCKCEE